MDTSVPQHLIVMGVAGAGKTTVATILAERLGWPVAEADEFHPPVNIAKMSSGTPLTDEDRWPWLDAMRDWLTAHTLEGRSTVVTCSALKVSYRDILRSAQGRVRFVHLDGTVELIGERLANRSGHFMPPSLLPSQFETLEQLGPDEDGIVVPVSSSANTVADQALVRLGLLQRATD